MSRYRVSVEDLELAEQSCRRLVWRYRCAARWQPTSAARSRMLEYATHFQEIADRMRADVLSAKK